MKHPYANNLPYTLTAWRECVIWVACEGGRRRECNAQVLGALGFHRGLGEWANGYVITHIPPGKAIFFTVFTWKAKHLVAWLCSLGDWNTRAVGKLLKLREAM